MKVYIVFASNYEDWEVEGVFRSKKDAERLQQSLKKRGNYYVYYVEEYMLI